MAVKTKRVVREVLVCDDCGNDIEEERSTHLEARAEGYFKRDRFEVDLCDQCGERMGLRRRGRKPASITSAEDKSVAAAPKAANGRRKNRKAQTDENEKELAAVGGRSSEDDDDADWEV